MIISYFMEENDRLFKVVDILKETKQLANYVELAKILGTNKAGISDLKYSRKKISIEHLASMSKSYPNINIDYIITGNGEILRSEKPIVNYNHVGVKYYDVDFVAGFDLIFNDQTINPTYYIDFKPYNHADFWVNVTGRSMEPMLSPGDMIAIKEIESWRDFLLSGEVYAIVAKEMRTIKIITEGPTKDSLLLIPVNQAPEYCKQIIQKNMILRVFSVLGCMKKIN